MIVCGAGGVLDRWSIQSLNNDYRFNGLAKFTIESDPHLELTLTESY